MKIEAFTIREIHMPLVHFFETSFGRTTARRILLLTVHCDGVNGWAECVAGENPFYSGEWVETAWPTIREFLAPAVLGRTFNQARECVPLMSPGRAHRMSNGAVENRPCHAQAKQKRAPPWTLLGGRGCAIACAVSIG